MQLLKVFHWIYEWSIVCLAALAQTAPERWAEAFRIAENVKWRSFTTLLRYLPLGMVDTGQEPLVQEEETLLLQLQSALGNPVEAALLRDGRVEARLNEIWRALEARFPDYVALRRQLTLSARDTAALLDGEVPVLVEYYLGEESDLALAFVVGKDGGASGAVLPATRAQIVELVRKLREQTDDKPVEAFNALSCELHRVLIEPISGHFVAGAGICFVPYGEMHNLPFATLFDNGFYLAEKHAVVIAPTASALRWWLGKDRRGRSNCLLFTATTRIRVGEKQLPDLLLFRSLAKTGIAPLFANHQWVESPPATKLSLLEQLQTARDVVHIACHGIAQANALRSFLALPGEGSSADRDLTAAEVATQVRCQTTLVTLSACHSAVAQASTGDDVAGLAQAFLLAGSSSVLASNAYVVQDLGVAITSAFYRYWKGEGPDRQAHSKLEALRLAQIDAMNRRNWFGFGARTWHPQQWGVFQLYGSWQ